MNGTSATNLFDEDRKPDTTTSDSLLAHAMKIDAMARELIVEVSKFRAKLNRSAVAAMDGLSENEIATKEERKDHPIKAIMRYFDVAHQRKFDGNVATFQGGKDSSIVKRLIAQHGEDKLRSLIDEFFIDEDEWLARTGYTISNFSTRIPGMIARSKPATKVEGVTARTAGNGRQADAGAALIRAQYGARR
jgi:hypothetical protein